MRGLTVRTPRRDTRAATAARDRPARSRLRTGVATGADLTRIAGRIAAILDVLTDEPISVRKLAAEVSMPKSTAFDYLAALESNGRAERTPRGWTQPSPTFLFEGCPADADDSENRGVK